MSSGRNNEDVDCELREFDHSEGNIRETTRKSEHENRKRSLERSDALDENAFEDEEAEAEGLLTEDNKSSKEPQRDTQQREKYAKSEIPDNSNKISSYSTRRASDEIHIPDMSKSAVIGNMVAMCGSSVLLFSAYLSIENLQSSINQHEGLGTTSVAVLYTSFILSLLLVAHITVSVFSYKWIYVCSLAAFLPYFATGFYSSWATMIPAAFITGAGAANFWNAQQGFLNDLALGLSKVTKMDHDAAVNLFCGIYYGSFFSAKVWGNLVSALVLKGQPDVASSAMISFNDSVNFTIPGNASREPFLCGSDFCSVDPSSENAVARPSDMKIYIYTGVCVGMGTLGVLMAAVFLTKTPITVSREKNFMTMVNRVILHMVRCRDQKILIFPTMLRGMTQAFMNADVTVAFISCVLGVEYVGLIMITYGVVGSIVSVIIGQLSKHAGWLPFFILAFVLQVSLCIVFLLIEPRPDQPFIIFLLASLWAIVEAVYTPSLPAIHSTHFEDKTAAISSCRVLDSLGFVLTFGFSSALCMRYKIYVMIGMATASMICLLWFHQIMKKRKPTVTEILCSDDKE